ncbi:MAG: dihydrodipicolinate reductase [Pseudomonadota bacterium]
MSRFVRAFALCATAIATASPALALDAISSRSHFLDALDGRELRIPIYTLRLNVRGDGRIEGRALGIDVTGDWTWQDGYFCREMLWGNREIPYNCQLVEAEGNTMRFTTDRGAGEYADFRLR